MAALVLSPTQLQLAVAVVGHQIQGQPQALALVEQEVMEPHQLSAEAA